MSSDELYTNLTKKNCVKPKCETVSTCCFFHRTAMSFAITRKYSKTNKCVGYEQSDMNFFLGFRLNLNLGFVLRGYIFYFALCCCCWANRNTENNQDICASTYTFLLNCNKSQTVEMYQNIIAIKWRTWAGNMWVQVC